VRRLPITRLFPDDPLPDPRLAYILDVIAARDVWMHRVDLSRATGRPRVHGDHETEIVAQVVRDLGVAWSGPALVLELTARRAAAGRWARGRPDAAVRLDAVECLRLLSGRPMESRVDGGPEATGTLAAARVPF
jgi:hypothetical protein